MTNPTTQPSQAAREAAADLLRRRGEHAVYCDGIVRGDWDDGDAVQAFARFERDTEKRVRESVGAAPDNIRAIVLKHTRVGGYPDTAAIARDAFAAGQNYCRESLAGEANVERVARVIELAIMRHGVAESDLEGTIDDALAALATLERTSDCPSCGGLNTSCPDGCGRDQEAGELNGTCHERTTDAG